MTDNESHVHVQEYEPVLGTKNYYTISGSLLYDNPYTGQTYHIVIHQAVEIPYFKHDLLYPMLVCTNCVTVNDCPRLLTDHPTEETYDIIDDDEWGKKVVLPLGLTGVTSYLPVGLLTENEWNQHETSWFILTNKHLPRP